MNLSYNLIKNKDKIVKRKSLYAQMKQQIEGMEKQMQDKEGTIETLERQLVQAGIKNKTMQGTMEINKKVAETKANFDKEFNETRALQQQIRTDSKQTLNNEKSKLSDILNNLPIRQENK